MNEQRAVIVGAGPAGLTAAYELLTRTNIKPVVLEMTDSLGGLSRTVEYKGNRIDIGGHRFFSKSDRVMQWWLDMLPLQKTDDDRLAICYQGKQREWPTEAPGLDPEETDRVMLVRPRKSRIYYRRKLLDYPLALNANTILNLGVLRTIRFAASYARARAFPIAEENSLEDFLINRFGRQLYRSFFKSYTEKVWGVPCCQMSAAWGSQRIKGLSVGKAVLHALGKPFKTGGDLAQKGVETSLVEKFLYPKYGPGQMWETCAERILEMGGEVHTDVQVERLLTEGNHIRAVVGTDRRTGESRTYGGDHFFSTMPIRDLVAAIRQDVPQEISEISHGLVYRDFIIVGLLVNKLTFRDRKRGTGSLLQDNWIYIQEPDVRVGRLQIFNNWSPYMVADPEKTWLGLEYFCNQNDGLWMRTDREMAELAVDELTLLGMTHPKEVLDWTVIRMPKAYPAYLGSYGRFDELRKWLDRYENLFLLGRNGMHRYNNQDHSMLTAMVAVDNISTGRTDKSNIWDVNTEQDYHETSCRAESSRGPLSTRSHVL
jgi:protoporphyrinogen oxidase